MKDEEEIIKWIKSDKVLSSKTTNKEIIEYLLTKVKPLDNFRNTVFKKYDNYYESHQKSLRNSQELRFKANDYYLLKDYNSSINCLTEAIMNAPPPSYPNNYNELSIAYHSRSELFFKLKLYKDSLFDIDISLHLLATIEKFSLKFDILNALNSFEETILLLDQIIEKSKRNEIDLKDVTIDELKNLRQRNVNYLENQRNEEESGDESKEESVVKSEDDKGFSDNLCIHESIEIISTSDRGRIMRAKDVIPMGTEIVIEKQYFAILENEFMTEYCNNCYTNIGYNIRPCLGCNEVVFCTEECADEAFNTYHKSECGFSGIASELGIVATLAIRMLTKIGCDKAFTLERFVAKYGYDFQNYVYNKRQQNISLKNKTINERLDEFKLWLTFEHHNKDWDNYKNVLHCYEALEPTIFLNYRKLLDLDIIEKFDEFVSFVQIFVSNIRRIMCNCFGYFDEESDALIAHVVCLVTTLCNHSCEPNTSWKISNRRQHFITDKVINKGDEITISYGPLWDIPLKTRQKKLKDLYHFVCNCRVCDEELKQLENYRTIFHRLVTDPNAENSLIDSRKALENIFEMTVSADDSLLADIRLLIQICVKLEKYINAIQYYEHFIKEDECMHSSEDFILWSNVF